MRARARKATLDWQGPAAIRLDFPGTALAVRGGLDHLLADPCLSDLDAEQRGLLWTVLAEILNNIVEHAYAAHSGSIQLCLWRQDWQFAVEVVDHGAPMPGLRLPEGLLARIDTHDSLPEGGFGWSLIRSLTSALAYDRIDAANRIRFCMNCGRS